MEMDPDLLDVEKKQGEGLQPTWGSAQRHGGTRLWHLHQPQSQKRFCPAALPTEQRGAAPCQRPPPCWDISQASSSSWKLLGLLGCGIRNASSPPPPRSSAGGRTQTCPPCSTQFGGCKGFPSFAMQPGELPATGVWFNITELPGIHGRGSSSLGCRRSPAAGKAAGSGGSHGTG